MQILHLGSIQFRYPQGLLETAPADASTWLCMCMVVCVASCVLLYATGKINSIICFWNTQKLTFEALKKFFL